MFWLLFLEMLRIIKPGGLLYLNVPSNGSFHRYPVDCWRFYPDSAKALVTWAKRSGYDPLLLESFTARKGETGNRYADDWNDFVAVFLKEAANLPAFPRRILDAYENFDNGYLHGRDAFLQPQAYPETTRSHFALLDDLEARRK
jgi:SAM-dependent methyltransferase